MTLFFTVPYDDDGAPIEVCPCQGHACGRICAPGCLGCQCKYFPGPCRDGEPNPDLDLTADFGEIIDEALGAGWDGADGGPGEAVDLIRYTNDFVDERGEPVTVWGVHSEIDLWRHASIFGSLEEAMVEYEEQVRWLRGE